MTPSNPGRETVDKEKARLEELMARRKQLLDQASVLNEELKLIGARILKQQGRLELAMEMAEVPAEPAPEGGS